MKKSLIALIFSLLIAGSSVQAQTYSHSTSTEKEKVLRAEQLADRFVQRFKETLDFEVVYREFFSADMPKRFTKNSILWSETQNEELMKQLSPAEAEQAYISFMNLYYLMGIYHANFYSEDEASNDAVKLAEAFPPELVQAMKEPALCPYFSEIRDTTCENVDEFRDAEHTRQFIRDSNRLALILRRHMPPEPFDSLSYKANLKQLVWNGRETSVDEGEDEFETGEKTTNYQVYREMFALNIVEENGEMRVRGIPIGN